MRHAEGGEGLQPLRGAFGRFPAALLPRERQPLQLMTRVGRRPAFATGSRRAWTGAPSQAPGAEASHGMCSRHRPLMRSVNVSVLTS